jgi:hypothetical protein
VTPNAPEVAGDPSAPKTDVCGSALELAHTRQTAKLFAKLCWPGRLGSRLFDACLLDILIGLALIAVAFKVQLFIDHGAIAFWLLFCFEH